MIKSKILNENSGFYNPFAEDLEEEKTKPISLKDTGNYLDKSKEDFSLTKLKWSKSGNSFKVKANSSFRKGEIVEICPVIIVGQTSKTLPKIRDIIFEINTEKDQYGLVLGYGSLYTHSDKPNMDFAYKASTKQMYFIARRNIKENEELTIDYGIEYFKEKTDLDELNMRLKEIGIDPIEESSIYPDMHADYDPNSKTKETFAQPNDMNNPAYSGVAIKGLGQQ